MVQKVNTCHSLRVGAHRRNQYFEIFKNLEVGDHDASVAATQFEAVMAILNSKYKTSTETYDPKPALELYSSEMERVLKEIGCDRNYKALYPVVEAFASRIPAKEVVENLIMPYEYIAFAKSHMSKSELAELISDNRESLEKRLATIRRLGGIRR